MKDELKLELKRMDCEDHDKQRQFEIVKMQHEKEKMQHEKEMKQFVKTLITFAPKY